MMREKLTRSGHDIREYRFTVSEDAFAELEQGRHVEIALPEAAGRSLIAHQTSYLWLQEHGRSRVLHLVPRRAQIAPLVGLSRWMAPEILTLGLSSARMSSPLAFRSIANAHRVYVSTPGLLINAIRRARFPRERMRQIGIVVLHGYDGLLSVDDDGHARWHQEINDLRQLLPQAAQLVLLTASSPLAAIDGGSTDLLAQSYATLIRDELYPVSLRVDPSVYAEDAPPPSVSIVNVRDDYVWGASEALSWEARDLVDQIGRDLGREIDEAFLLANLAGIASFRVNSLKALDASAPAEIPINSEIRKACYQIRGVLGRSAYLVEDMFQGLVLRWKRVETELGDQTSSFDRPYLHDERDDGVYRAQIEGKGFALEQVMMDRPQQAGLVIADHGALAEALCRELEEMQVPALLLLPGVDDAERTQVLRRFADMAAAGSKADSEDPAVMLVMTRGLLGVGNDLSSADYALFYSVPQVDASPWLAFSRLAAWLERVSESIMLCYEGTYEEGAADALEAEMACSGRGYSVVHTATL